MMTQDVVMELKEHVQRIKSQARRKGVKMQTLCSACKHILGGRWITAVPYDVARNYLDVERAKKMLRDVEAWLKDYDGTRVREEDAVGEDYTQAKSPEQALFIAVIDRAFQDINHKDPIVAVQAWRWWLVRKNAYREKVFAFADMMGYHEKIRRRALEEILRAWPVVAKKARLSRRFGHRRLLAFRSLAQRHLSNLNG